MRTRPPLDTAKQAHVARYNKFQACRYGLEAMVSDPVALCQTPLKQTLMDLLEDISMDASELGCALSAEPQAGVAGNAGDAAWLRASEKRHGNLNDVVREGSERLMGKYNPIPEKRK
ncbi:MAG: hypothetical protein IPO50_15815 [Sphingomonadales bacterium]|nr:hypothetical protein [Sphingomonadales bacterium]